MKIIAAAHNYPAHNKETGLPLINQNQQQPLLFLKPESALLKDGKPFFYPDFSRDIHFEAEFVVKISRLGKNIAKRFAHRYYEEVTIGIDFTAKDLLKELQNEGNPWEIAKSFDHSAAIGEFVSKEAVFSENGSADFSLAVNSEWMQRGNTSEMIYSIDELIEYASRFYTLKIGDILFTGTPAGAAAVSIGDHLQGYVGEKPLLDFYIR